MGSKRKILANYFFLLLKITFTTVSIVSMMQSTQFYQNIFIQIIRIFFFHRSIQFNNFHSQFFELTFHQLNWSELRKKLMKSQHIHENRFKIDDPQYLSKLVSKLIKNKMQPLSYKHSALKSQNNTNSLHSLHSFPSSGQKVQLPTISWNRKNKNEQNSIPTRIKKKSKNSKIHLKTTPSTSYFKQLQTKVENHVFNKKMLFMENKYPYIKEDHLKTKSKGHKQILNNSLEKYIEMFQMVEKPSEKVRFIDNISFDKKYKEIQSVRNIKNLSCILQNGQSVNNSSLLSLHDSKNQRKILSEMNQPLQPMITRSNDKKLRKQIMEEIKKQYQQQGSSKIRININHHKMIQLL